MQWMSDHNSDASCELLTQTNYFSMISLRKLTILATIAAFTIGLAACSKRNTELETDYATKKASAQTLIDQINTAMAGMNTDHTQWAATLATAAQKPGADTTVIGMIKADFAKHEADMAAVNALVDSTKQYMNATPDQADALKDADTKLGTNFNDLSDKWKSLQDAHTSLGQKITQLAAAPAADTTKAAAPAAKAEPAKKEAAKAAAPAPEQHHGAVRKSAH